jgi:protein-tyrosine phosphatase
MDKNNMRNIKYIIPSDPQNKIFMLLSLTKECRDVADPWYTGDFETTKHDVIKGCNALYEYIKSKSAR